MTILVTLFSRCEVNFQNCVSTQHSNFSAFWGENEDNAFFKFYFRVFLKEYMYIPNISQNYAPTVCSRIHIFQTASRSHLLTCLP